MVGYITCLCLKKYLFLFGFEGEMSTAEMLTQAEKEKPVNVSKYVTLSNSYITYSSTQGSSVVHYYTAKGKVEEVKSPPQRSPSFTLTLSPLLPFNLYLLPQGHLFI